MAKTRIRVLRNLASPLPKFMEQQVVDVDEETAAQLLAGKFAEITTDDIYTPGIDPPRVAATATPPTTREHEGDLTKLSAAEEAKRAAAKKADDKK